MDFLLSNSLLIYQLSVAGLILWVANSLKNKKDYIGLLGAVVIFIAIMIGVFK